MVKLLVFAILLASSSATGLIQSLYSSENSCYSGCRSNYEKVNFNHLSACRKGCDYKLHNEDCATQCKSVSSDEKHQASCQVGCTLSHPIVETVPEKPVIAVDPVPEKPVLAVDPVPDTQEQGIVIPPPNPEPEHRPSIILIRLRQRPSGEFPPIPSFFNNDPIQMFTDIIKQFQEKSKNLEQSIRHSFEQESKEFPKRPEFGSISELIKSIPINPLPNNIRADSSSESSEEHGHRRPLVGEFKHIIQHPREHQQFIRERMQPVNNRVQQFFADIHTEWNDLIRKQPKIPIWIFLCVLLSSSAILWYMVMSLCRHTPSRSLSIRAEELVFRPYEYDGYEKEKIQPDDQQYDVTEPLPIKVKLSNI